MNLRYRIHEWLADHVKWIQYPDVRALQAANRTPRVNLRWKHQMPAGARFYLACMSLLMLLVGSAMLISLGWLTITVLQAAFATS